MKHDSGHHHGSAQSSPTAALCTAAAAAAIWQNSSSTEPPERSASPIKVAVRAKSAQRESTKSSTAQNRHSWKSKGHACSASGQPLTNEEVEVQAAEFQSGVRHAGWLWKRFGHGHKATWKKLWVYLCDDRLCYHEPEPATLASSDAAHSPASMHSRVATAAMISASMDGSPTLPLVGYYGTVGSTASSLAALGAGEVRYIALDRIPVRPLPHRQHDLEPFEHSHPDVGITLISDGVLSGKPTQIPTNATFSVVAGSHTHYFAAESQHEAQLWVCVVREAWLHCFSHTARCTGGSAGGMTVTAAGVAVSQKLMAENALLRESIQELNQQVTQANGEYWRKWVEEKARNSLLESKLVNSATYELVVRTGNIKGAATDARVYVELYGPDAMTAGPLLGPPHTGCLLTANRAASPVTAPAACTGGGNSTGGSSGPLSATVDSSGEVRLFDADSSVKPFQRGAADSFTLACYNVGLPARLKVWHDNTGRYPDWFLLDIKVRKQGSRDWVTFPCNRWLSTQYEDGSISRVLSAGSSRPPVTFKALVVTSDMRGAGTDANVYLQLHGLLGDGSQHQLLGSATAFDRAAKDEFILEDADLGELTAVTISHDGSGTSPAWHLDHIEILPLPSTTLGNVPACTTPPGPNSPCSISSGGMQPPCSPDFADPQHQRRLSISTPQLGVRASLGSGQQLRRSTSRSSTPVPFSQSRAGANGTAYLFPCNAWLDETLGAGVTKRRLPVANSLEPKTWYTVYITTSDIRGAGTDADVHIALTGTQGSSGTVRVPSKPQQFQRGQRDKFRLELPPLGQLQKLLIGHNNQGQTPTWHLALVEVVDEDSGHTTYFAADRWLGGEGLCEVTLTASSTDPRQAQHEYQVCFLTSPCRGAGTDSCVSLELRGSKGSSGPITVSAGHEAFQRGGSDTFTYQWPYLGQLQQLVVWHDNSGAASAGGRGPWCLEAVVVTSRADQQVVTFPYGGWLAAETKLKVELLPGHNVGLIRYRFDVITSDVRGAGTDAAVSLELFGPTGTSAGPWVLDKPGAFARGQVDSFTLEGAGVLNPTSLKVALCTTQHSPTWHLDHIVCTVLEGGNDPSTGRKYYFVANRWLDAAAATVVLNGSSQLPAKQGAELKPYHIRVFTSRIRGAGTDANVFIKTIGLSGAGDWTELPARQSTFQQGQEDVFSVMLPDVGRLTHLAVRSDGSGQQAAWHLEKVCLQPAALANGSQPAGPAIWFSAHRWLDVLHGLEVLLPAQAEDPGLVLVPYQVQVYTSDVKNAGTDGRVFLQLSGEACTGPPVELQQPGDHQAGSGTFQRGCVDAFTLQLPVLGPLRMAAVWLEGRACAWHLDLIVVTGPQGDQAFFVCGGWLGSSSCGKQGASLPASCRLATALEPAELPASTVDPRKALKDYTVVIYTSDIRGAGTDAGVYVELIDSSAATSGRKQLLSPAPDAFERGKVDEFKLKCQALGDLAKLRIGHAGKGARPAWHLSKVEVTDTAVGRTWFFAGDCWLDASQGDGAIELLLPATDKDPWADRATYKVTVVTSKRPETGAHAALSVTLHGSKGPPLTSTQGSRSSSSNGSQGSRGTAASSSWASSAPCKLQTSEHSVIDLQPGSSHSFTLPAMHSLGQLRQLLLEIDSSTNKAVAWHCQHVEVVDINTGETWLFPCNAWLGGPSASLPATAAAASAQIKPEQSKLLLPTPSLDGLFKQLQEEQEEEQKEQYKVAVYTSAQSPAQGFVHALVVTITSAGGATLGPVRLSKAPQPCFTQSSCDTFYATAPCKLGTLEEAKVVCELSGGAGGAWHLDTIAVTAQSTGVTTWFYAGRWYDAAAGCEAVLHGSSSDTRGQLVQYKVTTHTSDIDGAGTTARVCMELSGTAGSSGRAELIRPSSITQNAQVTEAAAASSSHSGNGFGRGECADFFISCAALDDLQQLDVWHDSSGEQPAWHLAYVEVTEVRSSKVWYFPCNSWLSTQRDDGSTRRTLRATTSFSPDSLLMRYRVRVTTGDVRGAGTDAAAYITVLGDLGSTGAKRLNAPESDGKAASFDRGWSHETVISAFDVGEMTHVVIALDNTGLLASWFLERLEVEHLGTGQLMCFKVGKWLDDKRPGCQLQYELWPHLLPDAHQQAVSSIWELVIYTGKAAGAGTDADVSVELHGTSGAFGPHMLPAGTEAFQEGCRDTFSLETPDIGELLTLVISHNSKGRCTSWFIHGIELAHLASGTRYSWKVAAWLNPQQGCSRTLRAAHAQKGPLQPPEAAAGSSGSNRSCSYQLEVQTVDAEGAGTSASMFVQLGGLLGEAQAVKLTPSARGSTGGVAPGGQEAGVLFQRGCLDVFILKRMPDVGPFTHLIIGHDGTGPQPGWCLAWVRVINLTSGARALFAGNMWLDATRPGCQNWVKLPAGPDEPSHGLMAQQQLQQQQQQQPLLPGQLAPQACPVFCGELQLGSAAVGGRFKGWMHNNKRTQPGYSISFLTSNIWGGGTGSKVFFELIGEHGSSGVVYPTGPRSQFSRACKASFLYPRLPYVGQLHQLRVGTDGSGLFAAWHLRQVEVMHVHTGQRWLFDCNEWLDRRNTWQLLLPAINV